MVVSLWNFSSIPMLASRVFCLLLFVVDLEIKKDFILKVIFLDLKLLQIGSQGPVR